MCDIKPRQSRDSRDLRFSNPEIPGLETLITNDGDWVAIRDNFPSLLTSELQEKSYNSTEISQTPTHEIILFASLYTLNDSFLYKTQRQPIMSLSGQFQHFSVRLVSNGLNDSVVIYAVHSSN